MKQTTDADRQRRDVRVLGALGLLVAVLFGALYLMNLRSRMLYHGPNWSILGWIALYFAITGFGLLLLRKWALVLSFLPAIALLIGFAIWFYKTRTFQSQTILMMACQIVVAIIVPGIVLRSWPLLKW